MLRSTLRVRTRGGVCEELEPWPPRSPSKLQTPAAPARRRGTRSDHMTSRQGLPIKMAAYLQWRRFAFFDREVVKELDGGGAPVLLPPGITVCDSGRGSLVFGDILWGAAVADLLGALGEAWLGLAAAVRSASERVQSALPRRLGGFGARAAARSLQAGSPPPLGLRSEGASPCLEGTAAFYEPPRQPRGFRPQT